MKKTEKKKGTKTKNQKRNVRVTKASIKKNLRTMIDTETRKKDILRDAKKMTKIFHPIATNLILKVII